MTDGRIGYWSGEGDGEGLGGDGGGNIKWNLHFSPETPAERRAGQQMGEDKQQQQQQRWRQNGEKTKRPKTLWTQITDRLNVALSLRNRIVTKWSCVLSPQDSSELQQLDWSLGLFARQNFICKTPLTEDQNGAAHPSSGEITGEHQSQSFIICLFFPENVFVSKLFAI